MITVFWFDFKMKYYLTFFCLQTRHANNAVQRERAGPGGQLQADQQGQVHQVHIIYYEQYTFTFYKPANKIQYIRYILYIIHSTLLQYAAPARSSTSGTYTLYIIHSTLLSSTSVPARWSIHKVGIPKLIAVNYCQYSSPLLDFDRNFFWLIRIH